MCVCFRMDKHQRDDVRKCLPVDAICVCVHTLCVCVLTPCGDGLEINKRECASATIFHNVAIESGNRRILFTIWCFHSIDTRYAYLLLCRQCVWMPIYFSYGCQAASETRKHKNYDFCWCLCDGITKRSIWLGAHVIRISACTPIIIGRMHLSLWQLQNEFVPFSLWLNAIKFIYAVLGIASWCITTYARRWFTQSTFLLFFFPRRKKRMEKLFSVLWMLSAIELHKCVCRAFLFGSNVDVRIDFKTLWSFKRNA